MSDFSRCPSCQWEHDPAKPCPKAPAPPPGWTPPPRRLPAVLAPDSTYHDAEARCPECGVVRTLKVFAPADKLTLDRLCDACQGLAPKRPERTASLPYPDD